MAIDTADKRRNVAAIIPLFTPGVTPNAAKDVVWRQRSGWGYGGILVGEPEGNSGDAVMIPPWRRHRRQITNYI